MPSGFFLKKIRLHDSQKCLSISENAAGVLSLKFASQ